jgi:hypothetical protein
MTADWSTLSPAQLRCIDGLDFALPLHWSHMFRHFGVRGPTTESCIRLGLVRRMYLHEYGGNPSLRMPFLSLTQLGLAYQRDWRSWRKSASEQIARITGGEVVDARSSLDRGMRL